MTALRVETLHAQLIPHPDEPGVYLCCGVTWEPDDPEFLAHLLYRHTGITTYTDHDKRNALVPIFLESPQ